MDPLIGFALAHPEQAPLDHLERISFQVGKNEEQAIFRRRERTVLVHGAPAGRPRFSIEAPCRQMRLERGLERRDQVLTLCKGQARKIQGLRGARLHVGEPYTGHLWCLLSWEAQYTIIEINLNLDVPGRRPPPPYDTEHAFLRHALPLSRSIVSPLHVVLLL